MRSVIGVISTPSRAQARFLSPRLRLAGSMSHSAIMVSKARFATSSPCRRSTIRSYSPLWAYLTMDWSAKMGLSLSRTFGQSRLTTPDSPTSIPIGSAELAKA